MLNNMVFMLLVLLHFFARMLFTKPGVLNHKEGNNSHDNNRNNHKEGNNSCDNNRDKHQTSNNNNNNTNKKGHNHCSNRSPHSTHLF